MVPYNPSPNRRFEGTAEKLRFSVPRRLRRRAAPQAKRWASLISLGAEHSTYHCSQLCPILLLWDLV